MARTVEHIRGGRPGLPIYLSALRGSGKKAESCEKTPAGEPFRYAILLPYSIVGRSTSPASLYGNSSAEGKGLRTESGSVARPAIARTGCMNSECGPSIHRKSVIYLCSTPQVQIRDVPRRHIFPAAWPGREMIFRPSALPEDSLTGTVRNISDEFGRNVRRKAVSYRSGADSRSCGRTAIQILYYRKSGRGKSSYESRDHLRKTRSISLRASFSLMYSRLS